MPPKSKAQAGLMGAIAGGNKALSKRTGISRSTAREYMRGSKTKGLPARARGRGRR
jgi:DNA-binding FadR family transcriptional regulator